jgi:hypothetical protein
MGKVAKRTLLSVLVFAALVFYVWSEVSLPAVRYVDIPISGFPGEIKIVHISDAHGRGIPEAGRLSRAIRAFGPDVIALTGDMIDERTLDFGPALKTVENLSAIAPTLFIPGNHEHANPEGGRFISSVSRSGAVVLRNDAETVNGISICGIDDMNFALDNVPKALSVNGRCDILLSHSPAISESIKGFGIPLVLVGHTHGGQVRLPIVGALLLPDRNIPRHLVRGLAKDGDTQFYISVGLGTSVAPIRFMDRAEISLITVRPQ